MSNRILVADDSLTIQKVVGITLSDTDHELFQALTEDELMNSLESKLFDLVLLDFNLSENKSGNELIGVIRAKNANLPILVMLGTFDNTDEINLGDFKNIDHIVKPFESSKFISICEKLISTCEEKAPLEETIEFRSKENSDEEVESPTLEFDIERESPEKNTEEIESSEIGSGWEVDGPENEEPGALTSEVQGWGMSMPSIIGASSSEDIFPPVIESFEDKKIEISHIDEELKEKKIVFNAVGEEIKKNFILDEDPVEIEEAVEIAIEQLAEEEIESFDVTNSQINLMIDSSKKDESEFSIERNVGATTVIRDEDNEDMSFPDDEDLSYPDMSNIDYSGSVMGPTSTLVSLDELAPDENEYNEKLEKTDPQLNILPTSDDMAQEIHDESSPEEFWAVDDKNTPAYRLDEDSTQEFKIDDYVSGAGAVADVENFKRKEESFLKAQKALGAEEVFEIEVDNEVIIEKIKESLMPQIEQMIREICREKVEEISWEVIPDLAQNLITKEIQSISDSVKK